jgi:hypothetical protein
MADASDDQTTTATTTEETAAGAADKSTETTGKPTSDEGAETSTAADKGDDQATKGDDAAGQGGDEGAGDSASQADESKTDKTKKAEQNREAGKLRIAQKSEDNLKQLRDDLQTGYVDEAEDERDRQIRELRMEQYLEKVRGVNERLQRDNEQAAKEIDVFNSSSPSFNKALLDRTMKRYARDCLQVAEDGKTITGYTVPLLDYLREEADTYGLGSNTHTPQKKAATASAKMDAAAEDTGGSSAAAAEAKQTGKDSFDDLFLAGMDDPNSRHKPANTHTFST